MTDTNQGNEEQEFTPEQYKIRVLKQRIGEVSSNYEEIIANQAVRIAQLESAVHEYQAREAREEADAQKKAAAAPTDEG